MNEAGMDRTTPKKCPQCGASLPAGALAGLCPACLLQQGAAADTATGPSAKPFVPPTVEEVARLFPQLEILGFLGKGGMGAVYKARQPALDRLVALKILPAQAAAPDPGFAERFTREARALARLSHPNIVAVHEYGQVSATGADETPEGAGGTPALPYFIMEFVDGVNLRQLQKNGRLSPREALQIVPQICDALQYAHDEGVVHRDIKPENVLVDRKGRVKIADFGLAKILGLDPDALRLTGEGQVMGTPHYMAPEQVEHPLTVDHRADIFSLGVVFYEMLTGELPLGKFQPPSRKVQVDVRLDDVVLHALEKEPERRYQHVSEVKTDVQRITSASLLPGQAIGEAGNARPAAIPGGTGVLEPARPSGRAWKIAAAVIVALVALNCVIAILALRPAHSKSRPAGLVSWWRGEGNALDQVGGNNGVLSNGVGFDAGVVGQAFRFNGSSNSYVEVADSPTLRFTNALTIECWAKRLNTSEKHALVDKGGDWTGGQTDFEIGLNDTFPGGSKFDFEFGGGGRSCPVPLDTAWHHYAAVAVSGQADPMLYIDGVPQTITYRVGLATVILRPSTRPLYIGAQLDPQTGWFYYSSTMIDELAIFNRALSLSEIQAIYSAGKSGKSGLSP